MAKYGTHESFRLATKCYHTTRRGDYCGGTHGHIVETDNQPCVYCDSCGRSVYVASESEIRKVSEAWTRSTPRTSPTN